MNYLVYLRQHGFPSPLLDWSESEDVAASFAFRKKNPTVNCKVAIFLYVEFPQGYKLFHPEEPTIITLKWNVNNIPRHLKQQTVYTVCMRQSSNGQFSSHEDVFLKNPTRQDLLMKYVIPGSERERVLKELSSKEITAYSLFGSDDSLMETLAFDEIAP